MNKAKKAIVAVVGAVVAILAVAGTNVDPEISTAIVTALTAVAVYAVRNG